MKTDQEALFRRRPPATGCARGKVDPPRKDELVVVANRLPVSRVRRGGGLHWQASPGGLVSAITPFLREARGTWIGWSGVAGAAPEPFEHDEIRNFPVPLSREEVSQYYGGFCNAVLWPLYHDCVRPPEFRRAWWPHYVEVNRRFAAAVDATAAPGARVWIQDYHLQLVPGFLRERRPDLSIGFFLHIPFPPQELFAQLPWRKAILNGLLGADVIGFQRRLGSQNFGRLATRYTPATGRGGSLEYEGRPVLHASFPISIDFDRFARQAARPETIARAQAFRNRLGENRRTILGVDRLDYTKGIDVRLKAFRELIERKQTTVDECVVVQTAVPSREQVGAYKEERSRIEGLVGEINGSFGSIGRVAVHYIHRNLPFEELVALYRAADVMLVTPLRDGMNLVAKEYVASRCDEQGVLVLSEFAGAADELKSALQVNPHDVEGVAESISRAIHMAPGEQRRRMRSLRATVRKHDVFAWAQSFLTALSGAKS